MGTTPQKPRPDGSAIVVKGLTVKIGEQCLLDRVNLEVKRGEIMTLVGGSGTGKSVLLRTVIGLIKPVAGRIEVLGHVIGDEDENALDLEGLRNVQRRWGVLFQDGALFSSLTVSENVMVPLREFAHLPEALAGKIAAFKIAQVGLPADAGAKYPSELSGGMRKRAGLARALALDPELLFLDEPTSGLDPIAAAAFDTLVTGLQKNLNLTMLMVTHDIDSIRATADRVAVLTNKKLKIGTIDEIARDSDPWIHEYFNGARGHAVAPAA